jgi:hypothetical protein
MLRVDHVVLGVADLDTTAQRLAALGLPSEAGGRHPTWGTENRIVPLRGCYLELLAGPPVEALLDGDGERWLGWMVRTDDIEAEAARLGLDVVAMTRERPDGVELRWRLAGNGFPSPVPTFIQWDTPWDPGGDTGLVAVELAVDADLLREWVDGADLPVRVVHDGGPPGVRAVELEGPLVLQ